ncbi:ABC transporter ATP-binding protein [Marinobacter caseinilyticus]|uniref:ABC transporter ATP-binding protein n=1 Tax=Marinobacter caseinilyticus TaxID=2692195 RepID=UPI00140E0C01|nr:ATP-binding cassette domain-containing protein [Marinobacter caseinilyticus]
MSVGCPAVSVTGLYKSFVDGNEQVRVLENLTFTLPLHHSTALVGPSGSGKSTLINILTGIEPPDAGAIRLFGETVSHSSQKRWSQLRGQCIATVFQDANLMPTLSLANNIRLRAQLAGTSDANAEHWLNLLGLDNLGHRFPDQVSGGQRQRAALAMAFAMRPALLLADEPTGSLDVATARQVADALFHHQQDTGCPMLLSTHDPVLAARCDTTLSLMATGLGDP